MIRKITTPPTAYPITEIDVFNWLRLDESETVESITALIAAAVGRVELLLGRQLMTASREVSFASWGKQGLIIPDPPLQAVSSVKYYDTTNTLQTLGSSTYTTITAAQPGIIVYLNNFTYPSLYRRPDAITVAYTAGYASAAAIPQEIKHAILLLVGHYHKEREASTPTQLFDVPEGVTSLLAGYRIFWQWSECGQVY